MKRTDWQRIGRPGLTAIAVVIMLLEAADPVAAWNHTEIQWKTYSTEHFEIHFHPGEEWTARQVALIAEEIYGPITSFYNFQSKDRFHIILSDKEDGAEGATYYYLNKIHLSASELEFHFRGTANWLRNVVSHEFTHMVQVQSSMRITKRIPSFYIQAISFEREKRPDVITGYPNFMISFPVAGEIVPNWFAEGTAQYQADRARNDFWDSHRDMLLRTAALSDRLLSLDEMGVFGKNSLQSEMVYNQGYSLVLYIVEQYGQDTLVELTRALSSWRNVTFNGACKRVLGISEGKLYREWREKILARYSGAAERVRVQERDGTTIAGNGFMNLFPVRYGDTLFYLSNGGRDFSNLDLVMLRSGGKAKAIASRVRSRFSVSHDGNAICYAKGTTKNEYGYEMNDLFLYDLRERKERRVTRSLRATDPAWSPDDSRLACILTADGTDRPAIIDPESGSHRYLGEQVPGRQYFGLSWGTEGILAARFDGASRDIVLIDPETGEEEVIVGSVADERDPAWSGDGFFYASDRTGIFNIYYHRLGDQNDLMATTCIGGAFCPSGSGDGILYSGFGAGGYEIRELRDWRSGVPVADVQDDVLELLRQRAAYIPVAPSDSATQTKVMPDLAESETFGIEYTSLYLFPAFMVNDGEPRLGLFFDSRDLLDRQSVYGGGTYGIDKNFDLQLGFVVRQFKPTFQFDLFRSRRYYSEIARLDDGKDYQFDYRYDLWDAYFTCSFEFVQPAYFERKELAFRYNHGEYGLNLQQWDLLDVEIGWTYYKGNEFSLFYYHRDIRKGVDADINPRRGRNIVLEATLARSKLDSGEFEYGLQPIFDNNDFARYALTYEEYLPLPGWRHALSLMIRGGAIDNVVDDFFYLYIGGWDGLRGYSYYSIGGRKAAMARLTYRFPILRRINQQVCNLYLGSLYGSIFAEAGKAWDEDELDFRGNIKDVGYEVRLKGFTFYSYPLAVSFEAAYGLDEIEYQDPFNSMVTFTEGESWRYYGSILFTF